MSEVHNEQTTSVARGSSLGIPIAIVIAAALIAGAIVFTGMQKTPTPTNTGGTGTTPIAQETPETVVEPVTKDDHIKGNPNAPIVIVEYSDFECPYCKNFHETMTKVVSEFGADGKVAWVYRHFPIEGLHPNAPMIAAASECVADLGGNDAFWKFADLVFGERSINAPTDITKLPDFAVRAGVKQDAYEACVASGKFTNAINADIEAAVAAGAQGTPYSVLLVGDQKMIINGAQQLGAVQQMVRNALTQVK
jgi:protein-disulfide isomerase